MKNEQAIKAKINHLRRVSDRIHERRKEVMGGESYSTLSMNEKKIYSALTHWIEKISTQINALYFVLHDENELDMIGRRVVGIDLDEIMGGEDLFREDPVGFVIRVRNGNYLKGWSIEHRCGKDYNKFETTIYREDAVKFKDGKEESVKYITDGLLKGWEFEYIYE